MGREDHAPEVVEGDGSDGLIPAQSPKSDAPEAYDQLSQGQQSPPRYVHVPYASTDEKMMAVAASENAVRVSASDRKRKRLIWIIIGVVLLALAVGLGVGLGVGLSQDSNKDGESAEQAADNSPTTTISTTPTISTTSNTPTTSETATTAAPVTAGTTGVAAFDCQNDQTRDSTSGTKYITECYTQYSAGQISVNAINNNITVTNLGGRKIVYSLQACLDECDAWNQENEMPACRSVTFYANMTAPIQNWGGNCFLKNDQGRNFNGDNWVDWGHTVSAYQTCLMVSCWPEMPVERVS